MMYSTIKENFLRFHATFRGSATIFVARLNVALGSALTVVMATDPTLLANVIPILKDPRVLTTWIVLNGFLTEYARRRPSSRDALPPSAAGYTPSDSTVK